MNKDIYKLEKI